MSIVSSRQTSSSVTIAIAGNPVKQSEFEVANGRSIRIDIPTIYSDDIFNIARKDLDILTDIFDKNQKEIQSLVNAASAGKHAVAEKIARKIGLSEDRFVPAGGGIIAVVIVIAVAAALLLASDTPPTPSSGGADAGTG